MDVKEISRLEGYLKKLFGNSRLRVSPRSSKEDADVFVGEERLGLLTVDDEDGDRSYNFEMKIPGQHATVEETATLDSYLKRKFDNTRIRVVPRPKKKDSVEVYLGEEFIGVLFADDKDPARAFHFQMAILEEDLSP